MNKIYALFLCLFTIPTTRAQITIGAAEMPHAGDELVRVKAVTNPFINYAATGPSHTWDFSNLAADLGDTTTYQTVASANFFYAIIYADLGFNANRANHAKPGTDIPFSNLLPIDNPYTFRYRSNSVYRTVGYGVELSGLPVPIIFDEHDVIYELPLAYGNTSASHSSYHLDIPNVGYYGFEQDRENEVDGWGGITTPGGTWDVLRVRTTLTMRDTISGFAIDRPVAHEYKWMAQGLRVPVLQINTTTLFGFEVVNAIYYYDVPRTIEVVDPLATTICPGATLDVHYEATGAFNAGGFFVPANHFTAQLSDATGGFAAPVEIGDVQATTSGTIPCTIPANTPPGTGYRIRVISTSPDHIGTSDPFDITIGGATVASITAEGDPLICTGGTLMLTAVGGPGYQWQVDGADIPGATEATYSADAAGSYTVVVDNACGTATSNAIVVELNAPPAYTVEATSHLICSGSSVNIVAHDATGQAPLTYQWFLNDAPIAGATDTVVTATLAGIYTMEATNGTTGCSSITEGVTVEVQTVSTPEVTADGAITFCEGGSVTLSTAAAGTDTYQWYLDGSPIDNATSSSLLVDASGDFTVVVTSVEGCSSAPSPAVSVNEEAIPPMPVVTPDGSTSFCSGGAVTLSVPFTSGATYQWYQDGAIIDAATDTAYVATSSGDYTVIMTSAGNCASEASSAITITAETVEAPGVISTEPTTFCEGGGTTLIADLIDNVNYQWYQDGVELPGATGIQLTVSTAGAYTVTVTGLSGCSATSDPAVEVVVNTSPAVPVIQLSNDSLLVTSEGLFQWYLDGTAIPGATDPWWVPTDDGYYTLEVTDANGCSSISEAWLYLATAIHEVRTMGPRVSPNPSNGSFTIIVGVASGQSFEILDATGKRIRSGRLTGLRTTVDLDQAEEGMYFLRLTGQTDAPVLRIILTR